ncbi:MAG: RNA polymerase sporulation sigma factor SigG [Clostridiales bacterium]|nr:RNA polymerase sporulation sigma factor SigG [Clostridiales bacterium]
MQWGKVEICGINTSELKILKESEKTELLEKAKAGDKKARDRLIEGNLRLVLSVIQRFTNRGENPDDLFQVGCVGLIKAIDNFDTSLSVKFSTYAVPMIIGEIRRYLRDFNPVRVSRSMRDTAYHAMQVKEEIQNTLGRDAAIEEIAEKLQMPKSQVVLALEAIVDPVSLYEPVYSDSGDTIYVMDQVGDGASEEDWIDEMLIKESLQNLSGREKKILSMRFMQGKTQTEVANEVGISQAQVSRLEKGAIKKIKNNE